MATKLALPTSLTQIDFAELQQKLVKQFSGLNPQEPWTWPAIPQNLLRVGVVVLVFAVIWFVFLSGVLDEWRAKETEEVQLKSEYTTKIAKAVNLDVLKKQREQVLRYVEQLEKQLPGKSEMAALLDEINASGRGRSLEFQVFRPGATNVKEYYAEVPVSIKITGKYHDIGAFASDVASLSRIVTLHNMSITSPTNANKPADPSSKDKDGILTLETTAKTFRYLDKEEVATRANEQAAKAAATAAPAPAAGAQK